MKNLEFAVIEKLNSLSFTKKEIYKVEGIYPDDKNLFHIKICRSDAKFNISAISVLKNETTELIEIVTALEGTEEIEHIGVKFEENYLFATCFDSNISPLGVAEFNKSLEKICKEHLKARKMLLKVGCEIL